MNIKTKLSVGVSFLFALILLLGGLGIYYLRTLSRDTNEILVNNFESLEYANNMIKALDELPSDLIASQKFEKNLLAQEANISEVGEREITEDIKSLLPVFRSDPGNPDIKRQIRDNIRKIEEINMQAIVRKNQDAQKASKQAIVLLSFIGAGCLLIAFTFIVNFPGYIARPIKVLTESIKAIANKNYEQRLHFKSDDEFGELADAFNSMAKKLAEYNNSSLSKILFEKKRIETLINNMADPVVGLDEENRILFVNNIACKILKLKEEELIGKNAHNLAVNNDLIRSLLQELFPLKGGIDQVNRQPIKIHVNSKESYFDKEVVPISIIPTGEKVKKDIGKVIVLKNITPFKELDFAKTNFIATVSHELKTPIASIKMSLQLLESQQTGNTNENQKQLIESIKEDSNRLLKITSELLNLSQIETGNIQLNIQKSSPYQILQFATEAVKNQSDDKQIEISTETEHNLPSVKADSEKTAWVLINFLTNAISYSPDQSKIEIKIKKEVNNVVFSVKDQGRGIESMYRNKIFDRYFQIPGSKKTGTGLGLAISKEFIEAQGGEIGVESEVGMGSTFYFKLFAS